MEFVMRRGSVAIVPLIFSIMLFFWFIWFMGGENDSLFQINKIENLQHIQEEIAVAALQYGVKLKHDTPNLTPAQVDAQVSIFVNDMIAKNNL